MSDQGEFNRGYFGGNRDSEGSRAGANAAFWDKQAQQRWDERNAPTPTPASHAAFVPGAVGTSGSNSQGARSSRPATLLGAVKGGAGLCVAVLLFVVFVDAAPWTAAQTIRGGLAWGAVGAVAGGALYVAVMLLKPALRMSAYLLLVGVVLHLLGVVDLLVILGRAIRWLSS